MLKINSSKNIACTLFEIELVHSVLTCQTNKNYCHDTVFEAMVTVPNLVHMLFFGSLGRHQLAWF